MIAAPKIYADWVKVLDLFKEKADDTEVLAAMRQGTLQWQSGVAERFSRRLIDCVNHRMNAATDQFQKEMTRTNGQESALAQAIFTLKKELAFLAQALDLPVLPEGDRKHYIKLVYDQADQIQIVEIK